VAKEGKGRGFKHVQATFLCLSL